MILAERAMLAQARSEATRFGRLEIERLKLLLAKARREQYGQSSERGAQLIEQLELAIADLEETEAEDEAKAEIAAPAASEAKRERTGNRSRPPAAARATFRASASSIRRLAPARSAAARSAAQARRGCDRELECEPRRWKVVEHVREKFSCRACEAITQPPAPSHPIARGRAGPSLLALVLAREVRLASAPEPAERDLRSRGRSRSTSRRWPARVGASVAALDPILEAIRAHVLAAERHPR